MDLVFFVFFLVLVAMPGVYHDRKLTIPSASGERGKKVRNEAMTTLVHDVKKLTTQPATANIPAPK